MLLIGSDGLWVDVCMFVYDQVLRLNKAGTKYVELPNGIKDGCSLITLNPSHPSSQHAH